jgi:3-dehydroquinate synthase
VRAGVRTPDVISLHPGTAGGFDIRVGLGVIDRLASILKEEAPAHRYAVIADRNVAELHGSRIGRLLETGGLDAEFFDFTPGEASKTRAVWATLTDALLEHGFGRDCCIISLGGGVAGDLAGFVAATFMRGVAFVQIPTSLLAMIDASIGGKTGLDVPGGKNLVGAFLQPRVVLTDPSFLATLPEREFTAGVAEAVKHGMIASERYLEEIEANTDSIRRRDERTILELVRGSVRIKSEIVGDDVLEAGRRAILNFGHTIGHAIEHVLDYTLPHGFAVAMGMVVESGIGETVGITAPGTRRRLEAALHRLGLPTAAPPGIDAQSIVAATGMDKKARASRVRYALVSSAGSCRPGTAGRWTVEVPDAVVLDALRNRPAPVSQETTDV